MFPNRMHLGHHFTSMIFLPKNAEPESNHEETSDKFKDRDILQNNCPVPVEN